MESKEIRHKKDKTSLNSRKFVKKTKRPKVYIAIPIGKRRLSVFHMNIKRLKKIVSELLKMKKKVVEKI